MESLYSLLRKKSAVCGSKCAILGLEESVTISYRELVDYVIRTANWLTQLGVTKNTRFGILLQNTPEILLLELAAGIVGAAVVPLDELRDTCDRMSFKLASTGSKLLFTRMNSGRELANLKKIVRIIKISSFADFKNEIFNYSPKLEFEPTKNLANLYLVLYTSGTTANPKGAMLTLRSVLSNAKGIIAWQKMVPSDRFGIVLPLHHINSTTFCHATLLAGGTIVLCPRYSASNFWQVVANQKCTLTSVVPTILHDLLVRDGEFDKAKKLYLKRILIGSAPVLPDETERFYNRFGVKVIQGYGQTETALRVTGVPIDLLPIDYLQAIRSNTIGVALTSCQVDILDDKGKGIKEGSEGEICVRGDVLADGYWQDRDETAKVFKKGWFYTGDLGFWQRWQGRKYFFIKGRLKEIIIKGGINISPSSIEDKLAKNYSQIDEIAVVGYEDARMGEEIAAAIILKNGVKTSSIDQIKVDAVRGKIEGLSPYETPKKLLVVESLPKTSTGKIQRVEVKKIVARLLASEKDHHYFVRVIKANEVKVLKQAVKINNNGFKSTPSSLAEFRSRAKNGLVFGAFEEKMGLVGSLSVLRTDYLSPKSYKTWEEVTGGGSLANNIKNGNVLVCVAISVDSFVSIKPQIFTPDKEKKLIKMAKDEVEQYVNKQQDFVLEFHKKPKAGISGASVWKILPAGRLGDMESMGYGVIMKYPQITDNVKVVRSSALSPAVLLIEHAILFAKENGIKDLFAFSRPAGFREYLIRKFTS